MSCEYCDGHSNPHIANSTYDPKLLFCIRGTTLVMRALKKDWLYPQWLFDVNFCPICGRDLRENGACDNEDDLIDVDVIEIVDMPESC